MPAMLAVTLSVFDPNLDIDSLFFAGVHITPLFDDMVGYDLGGEPTPTSSLFSAA
jgi:hypothetical protein